MTTNLKQQKTNSRKTSLVLHTQSQKVYQSTLSSPKSNFSSRQLTNQPVPMAEQNYKKMEEAIERNQMSCQNHFLRKTILVLYKFFENMRMCWNFDRLNYRQMVSILRELRYIKGGEEERGSQNSQQIRKCYYLWVNLAQKKYVRLTNILIILCHVEHLDLDSTLIEEIVGQLSKGISKFEQKQLSNGDPAFIFLVKAQGWQFKDGLIELSSKQIKQVQGQLSTFKYTRLMESDPKVNVEEERQENPPFLMSKKSVELASNKREKILQEIKQNQQVQTIELYHILSYKKQIGKPAVSKIQECRPEPQKKKPVRSIKASNQKKFQGKGKQNRRGSTNVIKRSHEAKQKTQEKNEMSQLLGEDLGVSDITKTQIVDDLSFDYVAEQFDHEEQPSGINSPNHFLPHSLVAGSGSGGQEQKRRDYIELPILYVDVNIEDGKKERIVVYEGDTAARLAADFARKHGLCEETREKLEGLLAQQIGSVLSKIDEALEQDCSYLY